MKLISKRERNSQFNAAFDTGLIKAVKYDRAEEIFMIRYDMSDVGTPAGFVAPIEDAQLYIKITNQRVYTDCVIEFSDEAETDVFCKSLCEELTLSAEFCVQFSPQEIIELLIVLLKNNNK